MKVEQDNDFKPVVITLETKDELVRLVNGLCSFSTSTYPFCSNLYSTLRKLLDDANLR